MKVIFLGLPGAGKTTQGRFFASYIGLTHISVGDQWRQMAVEKGYDLSVPLSDELALEIALSAIDGRDNWVLDGFPRTAEQAEKLEGIDLVIYLNVPEEICIERILKRSRPGDGVETPQQRVAIDRARLPALLEYCRRRWKVIEFDSL